MATRSITDSRLRAPTSSRTSSRVDIGTKGDGRTKSASLFGRG